MFFVSNNLVSGLNEKSQQEQSQHKRAPEAPPVSETNQPKPQPDFDHEGDDPRGFIPKDSK